MRQIRDLIDKHPHHIVLVCDEYRRLAARMVAWDDVEGVRVLAGENGLMVETRAPDAFYGRLAGAVARGWPGDQGGVLGRRQPGSRVQVPGESMTTAPTTSARTKRAAPNLAANATVPAPRASARAGRSTVLTLRQHLHGKRWMVVALLFLLPAGLAMLIRLTRADVPSLFLEFVLLWILIPQALLPLVALLYASGIIQDEQEEQTITYLLIRPIPKWVIYAIKMAATWTTTIAARDRVDGADVRGDLCRRPEPICPTVSLRCLKAAAILSLAAIAYCSMFGAMSLVTKRTLVVGILYTAIVEGLLANLPLSLRW